MLLRPVLTALALSAALVGPAAAGSATTPPPERGHAPPLEARVLAISVDGLNTDAIRQLGAAGAPTFHRLLAEGAGTLNARTEVEQTVTLPNHTSMMTGRRIDAAHGGHGVTWDDDEPGSTVRQAAGHPVDSVFAVVHRADQSSALFTTKAKFSLYQRSWPAAIDRFVVNENQHRLIATTRRDLLHRERAFTFLHVSLPDRFGHEDGGMSPEYLDAVQRTDHQLGDLLDAIAADPELADLVVVLTSDHGFAPGETSHSDRTQLANYRVPFLVWGAGVEHGDLYRLNPDYKNPRTRRPSYTAGRQPVRNGDLANLSTSLMGFEPVSGSDLDADQSLQVVAPD